MSRNIVLPTMLLAVLLLSSCQTSSVDFPVVGQEPVREAPVNVLTEFIAPQAIAPQAVDTISDNLFDNGGFESGLAYWGKCDEIGVQISNDSIEGTQSLQVNPGHCFYRSAWVSPGKEYILSCYVKILDGSNWTGMGMGFSDLNFNELSQAPVAVVSGNGYARYDVRATAPMDSKYLSMWFYTDNLTVVDRCSLIRDGVPHVPSPTFEDNILREPNFRLGEDAMPLVWTLGCNGNFADGSRQGGLTISDGACFDQSLSAYGIDMLTNKSYAFTCILNNNDSYASMSIYLDGVVKSKVIPSGYSGQAIAITGIAPAQLRSGFVSLYSEGSLRLAVCTLNVEDTPVPENLLQDGNFDSADSGWTSCSENALNIANGSLTVSNGDCIYQTVPAVVNRSYHLQCSARATQTGWNNIILDFLDASWQSTGEKSYVLVRNQDLRDYSISLNSPDNAAHVAVSFYSEGQTSVDSCVLKETDPTPEDTTNLLENGGFEAGSIGSDGGCAHSFTSDASKVRSGKQAVELTTTANCLKYSFTGLTPGSYELSCYYKVQSEFLSQGPSAEWGYRYAINAGTSGANLLLPIDQTDAYRLHTMGANVNDSGKVTFSFNGVGLLFDDCRFTAQ